MEKEGIDPAGKFPSVTGGRDDSGLPRSGALLGTLVFCLAIALPARSPSLLWPLPFQEGCSSSFGEYRATHFHGGIDIPTRRTIGWPCKAVADGKVVRIRREAGGYGRVLYLELDDGRMAVYGHVCRFENEKLGLEDALLEACKKARTSFPGTVTLTPPPRVKAGQVVAYSGDLGWGAAHLHLEIRRGARLCDPFLEGLPLPRGSGPPSFAGVVFTPMDGAASVDGSFLPLFVPAKRTPGGFVLSRRLVLGGRVETSAVVSDDLGLPKHRTGVSSLRATLDGRAIFSMDLRCVSLSTYKQSPALFDPRGARSGAMAYRLRRAPGLTVAGIEGGGLPDGLAPGIHALKVTAGDRTGGSAVLSGLVEVVRSPVRWRLSLPGSGYRLTDTAVSPAGVVLTLSRKSTRGVTPVTVGNRPVLAIRTTPSKRGILRALIPASELPRAGASLALGGKATGWIVAGGPGALEAGGAKLTLPDGFVGIAKAARGADGEPGALLKVGPRRPGPAPFLAFPQSPAAPGRGIYRRKDYLGHWSGKGVACIKDGLYALRRDRSAPSWGAISIIRLPNLGSPELRIPLRDRESGPNLRTLKLRIDGMSAFADWDPDTKVLRVDLSRVQKGDHHLWGSCRDRAGNRANLKPRPFRVP